MGPAHFNFLCICFRCGVCTRKASRNAALFTTIWNRWALGPIGTWHIGWSRINYYPAIIHESEVLIPLKNLCIEVPCTVHTSHLMESGMKLANVKTCENASDNKSLLNFERIDKKVCSRKTLMGKPYPSRHSKIGRQFKRVPIYSHISFLVTYLSVCLAVQDAKLKFHLK